MQPVLGSTRPWLSGASLCGHASTKADHSVGTSVFLLLGGKGLCHTARSIPHTLICTGVRPVRDEALPSGIQAPRLGPDDVGDVDDDDDDDGDDGDDVDVDDDDDDVDVDGDDDVGDFVVDSDDAKMHDVLEGVSARFMVRKRGDDAASDGWGVLGEGRKALVGAIMATATAATRPRPAEKGGVDTIFAMGT